MNGPVFLPDRLRPGTRHRRPRRRLALVAALPGFLLLLPLWRVQTVDVTGCPGLPAAVEESLHQLEGVSPLTIDLDRVREQVEMWPGVAAVEVHLELPGTLRVTAQQATARASVRIGHGWHGVDDAGSLTGALDHSVAPILEDFRHRTEDLRRGLEVAERMSRATGGDVRSVRQITPSDLEIGLVIAGAATIVHVKPEATAGERIWCERAASGQLAWRWADLRWDSRMVLGQAEPDPATPSHREQGGAL